MLARKAKQNDKSQNSKGRSLFSIHQKRQFKDMETSICSLKRGVILTSGMWVHFFIKQAAVKR